MKKNKRNKNNKYIILVLCLIILALIITGIVLLVKKDDSCKWCDNTNTECYLNEDGKTNCRILDN